MRMFAAVLLASAALAAPAHAVELITNGSFEAPAIPANSFLTRDTATQGIPSWTIVSGNVDIVNSFLGSTAADGANWLDLVGSTDGTITQSFNTVLNKIYTLTFQYGHNDLGGAASRTASYSVGALAGSVTHTGPGFNYNSLSATFLGTGGLTTLTFANVGGSDNAGIALDAVSVSAIPEPATWALMIMGFGVVGGAMRIRKARQTLAFA